MIVFVFTICYLVSLSQTIPQCPSDLNLKCFTAQVPLKVSGMTKQWEFSKQNSWPRIDKQPEAPAEILAFQVCLAEVTLSSLDT